jgi:hypothetical protein
MALVLGLDAVATMMPHAAEAPVLLLALLLACALLRRRADRRNVIA